MSPHRPCAAGLLIALLLQPAMARAQAPQQPAVVVAEQLVQHTVAGTEARCVEGGRRHGSKANDNCYQMMPIGRA